MTRSVRWRVRAAVLGVGTRVAVVIGTRTNTSTSMAAVLDIRTSRVAVLGMGCICTIPDTIIITNVGGAVGMVRRPIR